MSCRRLDNTQTKGGDGYLLLYCALRHMLAEFPQKSLVCFQRLRVFGTSVGAALKKIRTFKPSTVTKTAQVAVVVIFVVAVE